MVRPRGEGRSEEHPFLAHLHKIVTGPEVKPMTDGPNTPEEERQPTRPRVVDKRVSSRSAGQDTTSTPPPADAAPAQPPPPVQEAPPAAHEAPAAEQAPPSASAQSPMPGQEVWTPEQEAEAQALLEEMARRPALDWIVNSAVTLVNVAAAKLDTQQFAEAQVTIDALDGLLKQVGPKLGNVEQPLRQTLAQLQMAYAQAIGAAPGVAQPGEQ